MSPPPERERASDPSERRLLMAFGCALWVLASLAAVWEVLALQPPSSALHLGILASPITQLRNYTFALGTGTLLVALLWPYAYERREGRAFAFTLLLGITVQVVALIYASASGLLAVQIFDPRADARYALYARAFGHALITLALLGLATRFFRRRR